MEIERNDNMLKKFFSISVIMMILCVILCSCKNKEYIGKNVGIRRMGLTNYASEDFKPSSAVENFEIDEDLAINIGNSVLKSVYGEDIINSSEYVLAYYEDVGIYKFARIPDNSEAINGMGEDWAVIIRKSDGAILKVWIEG